MRLSFNYTNYPLFEQVLKYNQKDVDGYERKIFFPFSVFLLSNQAGIALSERDMSGDLARGEPTVQLSSSPGKNNANHVNQVTTVLLSMRHQPQDNVMLVFSATMVLTNSNHLVVTEVLQVFVPLDITALRAIHLHQ